MDILHPEIEELDAKRMILNFGPQHPATHGTLRSIVELDGERAVSIDPELGYLHSGFEKQSEYMTYEQVITVTDRMNYMSATCNNIGFALAVEEMLGVLVTPRCAAIRVLMYELGRIADHILCTGLQAMDLGAYTVMLWSFIERERTYDIFETVTGGRLTTSYTRIGGLARDIPDDFADVVREFMTRCAKTIDEIDTMLTDNKLFIDRTKGIGVITREQAISLGLSGPLLRASGVKHDLRKARPYLGYEKYDFDVPVLTDGDVYSRYLIRLFEMKQSMKIIDQVLKDIPKGPINVDDPRIILPAKDHLRDNLKTPAGMTSSYSSIEQHIFHFKHYMFGHGLCPPKGEIYSATESPNGELGFYLVSDGTQRPFRMRVRPPSFYNYQAFPHMAKGGMIPDMVACLSSINVIAGELDR